MWCWAVPLTSSVLPWLGWGQSREPVGGNRTMGWTFPTGRDPLNCQLASSRFPTHSLNAKMVSALRASLKKVPFFLLFSYPLITIDHACRPALPSSAPLLRPVSCQSPRSSPHSRSGSRSSFLLRRKRYARVICAGNFLLRWHSNFVIDVTFFCRSRRRALSMVKSHSGPSSSTNSMGIPYCLLFSFLSDL